MATSSRALLEPARTRILLIALAVAAVVGAGLFTAPRARGATTLAKTAFAGAKASRPKLAVGSAVSAPSFTYTVASAADADNDTNDPASSRDCEGACTLREAIDNANFNCSHDTQPPTTTTQINFAIGSGVRTINLTGFGLAISCPVILDGRTQPGYRGSPLIEINGAGLSPNLGNALSIQYDSTAAGSVVRGLVINRTFDGAGLSVCCDGNFTIQNNFLGTDVTGTKALPNSRDGLSVNVAPAEAPSLIGGTTPAERNILSGNTGRGVNLGVSQSNTVEGNYIGTDVTGTKALGNSIGVAINPQTSNAIGNTVGGSTPGAGNLISGNRSDGIDIFAPAAGGNRILGNLIGTQVDGASRLGNGGDGVHLQTSGPDTTGGTGPGNGNTIAFNGLNGVEVDSGASHAILSNRIYANGHPNQGKRLGIVLLECSNCDPVTANQPGGPHVGPNHVQNYPILTSRTSTSTSTKVKGTLNSTANTTFTVQLYASTKCGPTGYGEGQQLLATQQVTTVGNNVSFKFKVSPPVPAGRVLTATATDPAGNTSEFSPCLGPLSISPSAGIPGSTAVVAGNGFAPFEAVTVNWNCADTGRCSSGTNGTIVLGTTTTGAAGTFSLGVTIPAGIVGTHAVGVIGGTSHRFAVTSFTVQPAVTISPASGPVGSHPKVSGHGFGPSETVKVRWNCGSSGCSSTTVLATVTTDGLGSFVNTAVTIPAAAAGTYPIGAKGATTASFAEVPFMVT